MGQGGLGYRFFLICPIDLFITKRIHHASGLVPILLLSGK